MGKAQRAKRHDRVADVVRSEHVRATRAIYDASLPAVRKHLDAGREFTVTVPQFFSECAEFFEASHDACGQTVAGMDETIRELRTRAIVAQKYGITWADMGLGPEAAS